MSEELKLCPFCGGEAKLFAGRCAEDAEQAFVRCKNCLVQTDILEDAYAPSREAIAAWNTRAPTSPDPMKELCEADIAEAIDFARSPGGTFDKAKVADFLNARLRTALENAKGGGR